MSDLTLLFSTIETNFLGYLYKVIDTINIVKLFLNFIIIVKYIFSLKTLLQQGISDSVFYGYSVYKSKRIVGKPNFSDQFKR